MNIIVKITPQDDWKRYSFERGRISSDVEYTRLDDTVQVVLDDTGREKLREAELLGKGEESRQLIREEIEEIIEFVSWIKGA